MKSRSIKDKLFSLSVFFSFHSAARRNQFAFFDRLIPAPPFKNRSISTRRTAKHSKYFRTDLVPPIITRVKPFNRAFISAASSARPVTVLPFRSRNFDRVEINGSINGNRRDDIPRNEIQSRIINRSPGWEFHSCAEHIPFRLSARSFINFPLPSCQEIYTYISLHGVGYGLGYLVCIQQPVCFTPCFNVVINVRTNFTFVHLVSINCTNVFNVTITLEALSKQKLDVA